DRVFRLFAETAIAAIASTPQPAAAETVERAVAAERERCAKIAEDVFSGHGKQFGTQRANNYEIAGKRIAAAIRQSAKGGE
ncbi:hypothetical protein, partial [Rhizorhabdus wittichii]|uniref:hypothetical protein n=1 Tax=Rhizorhabdus wittichii TaxID=160791 RepID=UPI0005645E47